MSALSAAASIAAWRLRTRAIAVGIACVLLFIAIMGLLERREDSVRAVDRTLLGAVFGVALPLFAYVVVGKVSGGGRLSDGAAVLARHGADRKRTVVGILALAIVATSVAGAAFAAFAVVLTRGVADPGFVRDLAASSVVGMIAGATYVCWFSLGAELGVRGGGRTVLLVLDWVMGSGTSALAAPWPRAHVRNLLAAEPVLGISQSASLLALLSIAIACVLLALWRTPH